MINRQIKNTIKELLISSTRPLILTGARQVGKTTLARSLEKDFDQFIEINLFTEKKRHRVPENFEDFLPAADDKRILLFFDNCDISHLQSIQKISRYGVSVIAACTHYVPGSFIVRPFSYYEFLLAMEEEKLALSWLDVPYPPADFDRLIRLFHLYSLIGGMPEIIEKYFATGELSDLQPVYNKIYQSFINEINLSCSSGTKEKVILNLQNAFPFAANRIKFNHFGTSRSGSRDNAKAMKILEKMGILSLVYPTVSDEKTGNSSISFQFAPRLHIFDTGLVNFFSDISEEIFNTDDLLGVFGGQIAKHIAGQEILFRDGELNWWMRSKPQSIAEVDFLISYEDMVIPVEVKQGEPGRLRSLFQYIDRSPTPFAVRLWGKPLEVRQCQTIRGKKFYLLNLPYFLAGRIKEYLPGFIKLVGF